jgi:hypothetical protein
MTVACIAVSSRSSFSPSRILLVDGGSAEQRDPVESIALSALSLCTTRIRSNPCQLAGVPTNRLGEPRLQAICMLSGLHG